MIYLNSFTFPNENKEIVFITDIKRTCYDSFYPFNILSRHGFERMDFEPVTILYGGNGSGKTTAFMLNIRNLNEGIDQKREKLFEEYLDAKYSHFQMKSHSRL